MPPARAKQRRVELGLNQPYVAEKMGVATSTIVRYEAGTIDNTKKLVLEGLSEALHVSVEWLKGETEEYETDITDKKELYIRDVMTSILSKLPFDMEQAESDFTKDLLLLMLREYELFVDSFQFACRISRTMRKMPHSPRQWGLNRIRNITRLCFSGKSPTP